MIDADDVPQIAPTPSTEAGQQLPVTLTVDKPAEAGKGMTSPCPTPSKKAMLTAGFAIAAGWADVICFKGYSSFAALMTGNTVKLALAPVEGDDGGSNSVYFVAILASYIAGVVLFQVCKKFQPGVPRGAATTAHPCAWCRNNRTTVRAAPSRGAATT